VRLRHLHAAQPVAGPAMTRIFQTTVPQLPMTSLTPATISNETCIKHEMLDEEIGHSTPTSFNSAKSVSHLKSRDEVESAGSEAVVSEDESNTSVVVVDLCSDDNFEVSLLPSPKADLSSKKGDTVVPVYADAEIQRDISSRAFVTNREASKSTDFCVVDLMDSPAAVSARKRKRPFPHPSEVHVVEEDGPLTLQHNDRSQVASTVIRPFSCPICLEDVPRGAQACILGCGHRLCFGCAGSFVALKVQEAQVRKCLCAALSRSAAYFVDLVQVSPEQLRCPLQKCTWSLAPGEVRACLAGDAEARARYDSFTLKRYLELQASTSFLCPTPACEFAAELSSESAGSTGGGATRGVRFACPCCQVEYCLVCRLPWHGGEACLGPPDGREGGGGAEDRSFLRHAGRRGLQRCPKCRFWVEKSEGCNAVLCRCGTTFCWRCGGDVNGDAGCACMRDVASLPEAEREEVRTSRRLIVPPPLLPRARSRAPPRLPLCGWFPR
jgi:hypothetical protein